VEPQNCTKPWYTGGMCAIQPVRGREGHAKSELQVAAFARLSMGNGSGWGRRVVRG